jgi:uncharacterized protein (DUF2147 family)
MNVKVFVEKSKAIFIYSSNRSFINMKNGMRITAFIGLFLLAASFIIPAKRADDGQPDDIVGVWKNGEGTGLIQISKGNDGKYYGKIVWLKVANNSDGTPRTDINNPDEKLRARSLRGLENLQGFKWVSDGIWEEGTIYDPKVGKTYSCTIKMPDWYTLEVRGYIGISAFGRTDVWKRQEKKS